VVSGVDGDGVLAEILRAADCEAGAGEEDTSAGPEAGNVVLYTAAFLDEGNEEREGAAAAGPEKEEWGLEEVGAPAVEAG
jgi:hypothetical protein